MYLLAYYALAGLTIRKIALMVEIIIKIIMIIITTTVPLASGNNGRKKCGGDKKICTVFLYQSTDWPRPCLRNANRRGRYDADSAVYKVQCYCN